MANKKKDDFGKTVLKSAVIFNPVLIQLAGICIVAAASTDVITSLAFTIMFSLVTVVNCFIASLLLKKVPRFIRVAIYMIISLAIISPIIYLVESLGFSPGGTIQLYMPLLAVNSVTSVHCEQFSVNHSVRDSLRDAFAVSIGFGSIMIILGILREALGSAAFAGLWLGFNSGLRGMLMPFGSFILLGYLAIFLKWYINKYKPEYVPDTSVKIKTSKVTLRKGEVETEPQTEILGSGIPSAEDSVQEIEFLFGNEPEEIDVFTEFWAPEEITREEIDENIEALNREHEQFSLDTDKRIEDLFNKMDSDLSFVDFEADSDDLADGSESENSSEEEGGKQ